MCGAVLVFGNVIASGLVRRVGFSASVAKLEIEDLLTVQCSHWERCMCFSDSVTVLSSTLVPFMSALPEWCLGLSMRDLVFLGFYICSLLAWFCL